MSKDLMAKKTGKRVKLYIAQHKPNETILDSMPAKEWGDFLIISVKNMSPQHQMALVQTLQEYGAKTEKVVILVENEDDISFYGVEIEE